MREWGSDRVRTSSELSSLQRNCQIFVQASMYGYTYYRCFAFAISSSASYTSFSFAFLFFFKPSNFVIVAS